MALTTVNCDWQNARKLNCITIHSFQLRIQKALKYATLPCMMDQFFFLITLQFPFHSATTIRHIYNTRNSDTNYYTHLSCNSFAFNRADFISCVEWHFQNIRLAMTSTTFFPLLVLLIISSIHCAKVRVRFEDVRASETVRYAYFNQEYLQMVEPRNGLGILWHQIALYTVRGLK